MLRNRARSLDYKIMR
ncbi:TPA: hypothetical protein ACP2TD_000951 [Escherichia coli]